MCDKCGCDVRPRRVRFAHDGRLARPRVVRIEEDLLASNQQAAQRNRARLRDECTLAINLVSGPGAGKTSLLERTVRELGARCPVAVIEGDQQTARDAERIRACGAKALQINTGKGCHLDAHMIERAFAQLDPFPSGGVLFIENVGNLVCPSEFDLGEQHRVVLLSCTEGEDKPVKYPHIFAGSSLMLLTKVDLLPHLRFDVAACLAYALQVNPKLEVMKLSSATNCGVADWLGWLEARRDAVRSGEP